MIKDLQLRKEMKEYMRNEFEVTRDSQDKDYLMALLRQKINYVKEIRKMTP